VYILNEHFPIPQLNRTRRVWVYLPPDYKLSQNHYPVIYLQDGQNLFDNATSFSGEWGIDESLEQLFAGGDAGAIVVGVDNGGKSRIDEYAAWKNPQYGGGEGVQYMDFLVNTLKPYIDSSFRTLPDRLHTAIGGSSMGGLISMYGGIEFQQVFGKLLIFSPSFWFSPDCYTQISQKGRKFPTRIYMLCGTPEGGGTVEKDMKQMYQTLIQSGFDSTEVKFEVRADGQHSEWFWRREFTDAYKWLFETDANAVEYSSNDNLPFVLSPMPFSETFAIQWKVPTKTYTVSIFSSTGQNVFFQILNSNTEINITGFPKGIYLLIIEENGNTYRKKILKE
jgi:predicted alpha/beta superfamily hydrolase